MARIGVAAQLRLRLRDELDMDVALPERTRAGRRQLEQWCWSWTSRAGLQTEVASIHNIAFARPSSS